MNRERERLRTVGKLFSWIRLLAAPFAAIEVASTSFPSGYRVWAWIAVGALATGALILAVITWRDLTVEARKRVVEVALAFDTIIVFAFIFVYSFRSGQPTWALFYIPTIEGALRFGTRGGIAMPLATAPLLAGAELWRSRHFGSHRFQFDSIAPRVALGLLIGAVIGRLVTLLVAETKLAEQRVVEAERLRDELGRRADVLEAATRCARALSSSLELDDAFSAFIRELRALVPFERTAIVLADDGAAQVMAVAGAGAETVFSRGTRRPVPGSLLEELITTNRPIVREEMADRKYPEEAELLELGLHCRLAAPLLQGPRTIGMLSLVRREPSSFRSEEIELVGFLGRLVAGAVQNIRSYEAERTTVEELRRLSALRADFVSLVSHELRTPMASLIGSAQTLQQRWRELAPEQRESFLALIANETGRLAALVEDVLDTSRIDGGTFSYRFDRVDLAEIVRDSVSSAAVAQDEVEVRAEIGDGVPLVRGDRDRLRQVLVNLVENAVKYSPTGGEVDVRLYRSNSHVRIDVEDRGPGIAREDQRVIFEKFGRANPTASAKPGTGLGLFIARSIVEAHGGTLDVISTPDRGATFTVALPLDAAS